MAGRRSTQPLPVLMKAYLCRMEKCDWFSDWFNSPYYHILYGNRDESEAAAFIAKLAAALKMPPASLVLDLACGRGRHAVTLNRLGMHVTGLDLSPESIAFAKKSENDTLEFFEHDMRRPFRINYYDYVLNLFTSFGYFGCKRDNAKVVQAVHSGLKTGGIFVLDFFNGIRVAREIGDGISLEKEAGGIRFHIRKYLKDGHIRKEIRFQDAGREHLFTEEVQLLLPSDFLQLLGPHFKNLHLWGNYALDPFDGESSDRCIVVAQKI